MNSSLSASILGIGIYAGLMSILTTQSNSPYKYKDKSSVLIRNNQINKDTPALSKNQAGRRTARFTLMALGHNTPDDLSLISHHYDLMIASSLDNVSADVISTFRKRNPGALVFCYFNTSDASPAQGKFWEEVNSHEDWFHHDINGERVRIYYPKYKNRYAFNTGNRELQKHLADNVVEILKTGLYDGIQLDNVSTEYPFPDRLIGNWISSVPVKLTPEKWTADEVSMLKFVMNSIKEAGFSKTIIYNHMRSGEPVESKKYIEVTDGANCEFWMSLNTSLDGRFGWKARIEQVNEANRMNKLTNLLCVPKQLSEAEALYCFASYLLALDGSRAYFFYGENYRIAGQKDAWYPFYDLDLGKSIGAYEPKNGGFSRAFEKGAVLVNPMQTAIKISLDQVYKTMSSQTVKEILLEPKQAVILLK